ncbi:MAG: 3'(2'),5'-bisphosphate nucleotidase CysQ [bacterium]|nr:3'(2'),5'-bisphosphate nucleotidase CysQ [bacterium]
MKLDLAALLPQVTAIAAAAGVDIMAIYRDESRWDVQNKNDDSPLTAADIAANRTIVAGLEKLAPDIPVISEECDEVPFSERSRWSRCWVVDPLDGTKEFIARNDEFSVNIALVENHEAVLGVVYSPVTQTACVAARGLGAFRIDNRIATALKTVPLPLKKERAVRLVASRRHRDAREALFMERVQARIGDTELATAGSAFKICAVAEGLADAYPRFGPTMEWDTAAGQVVIEEAGGALLDEKGRAFRYNERESLLNGSFIVLGDAADKWLEVWLPAHT